MEGRLLGLLRYSRSQQRPHRSHQRNHRTRKTHRQRLPQPHQLPTPNAPHRRRPRRLHPHSTLKSQKTRRPEGGWEYTHERLVRARNSLNKLISQGLLFTYLDPLGTSDARDDQPDRKHERPITPDAARPPRNVPDPTYESRVLVVLHPLSSPATSSDDPGDHAHRRSPRKCLVPRQPNPPSHRHHPRLGRRNLLQRTPPHHPLPQHLGLTPATPITRHCRGPLKIAGVEVRSSSRTSTSTRNPRPRIGHPHSTRKSQYNYARFTDLSKNPELIAANRIPVENI